MSTEPVLDVEDGRAFALGVDSGPQPYLNGDVRGSIGPGGSISYTINEAAIQLIRGEPGWSRALGEPFTVTYAFRASAPLNMPDDTGGFSRFNAAQIIQTELALSAWSDAANIRFMRVGAGAFGLGAYSDSAAILFGNYATGSDGAAAFAYYPGSTSSGSVAGDVWVNSSFSYNQNPTPGNYGGHVLVHEIGHAIGLAHPADYDAGVDGEIEGDTSSYYEDSRQYTVMSYHSESTTGAYFAGVYSAAPLLDDIAAVQLLYGANMSTRVGDTVYGFNSNAGQPWFQATSNFSRLVFAVWDAGGADTFDFSGFGQNQLIDLRPGFFSDVGGLRGNVAIAEGVTIETALGGSGSDTINAGDAGSTMFGGAGNDLIIGGAGFDRTNGNLGFDTVHGGGGNDWVTGGQNDDRLFGDDGDDILNGNLGADTGEGGAGADTVRGGQGNDRLSGGDGDDLISGDLGDDTLTGGAGADAFRAFAGGGHDVITDFNPGEGDRILLDPGTTYQAVQLGSDVVLDLGGGAQTILKDVSLASLTGGWIV